MSSRCSASFSYFWATLNPPSTSNTMSHQNWYSENVITKIRVQLHDLRCGNYNFCWSLSPLFESSVKPAERCHSPLFFLATNRLNSTTHIIHTQIFALLLCSVRFVCLFCTILRAWTRIDVKYHNRTLYNNANNTMATAKPFRLTDSVDSCACVCVSVILRVFQFFLSCGRVFFDMFSLFLLVFMLLLL